MTTERARLIDALEAAERLTVAASLTQSRDLIRAAVAAQQAAIEAFVTHNERTAP